MHRCAPHCTARQGSSRTERKGNLRLAVVSHGPQPRPRRFPSSLELSSQEAGLPSGQRAGARAPPLPAIRGLG